MRFFLTLSFLTLSAASVPASAQDNYEIQVYGYDTVAPGHTMVELHSNFTVDGSKAVVDGVLPTNHAEHETLEITQGFTDWFETGFYVFTSIQPDGGWRWVTGDPWSYSNWNAGEPNNATGGHEDCLTLAANGRWNDTRGAAGVTGYLVEY